MFWLKVGTQRFPIREGETTLGRSRYCSVLIDNASASREHAAVQFLSGALTLSDLDSRNGTMLNGRRVTGPCPIKPGDQIFIGDTQLQVVETNTIPEDICNTTEQQRAQEGAETPTMTVPPLSDETD